MLIWTSFLCLSSVGAHFIYGSWYKKSELGTRAAIFCGFGNLGNMAGGWIQAGLLTSLHGRGSLPAWRWMFIVVAIMTIPFAIFGMCGDFQYLYLFNHLHVFQSESPKWLSDRYTVYVVWANRLVLHSRPPASPERAVLDPRRERVCHQAARKGPEADLGCVGLPPRPSKLAVLASPHDLHA